MTEQILFTIYSLESEDFLTLGLGRDGETTVVIQGFLILPYNQEFLDLTEKQKQILQSIKDFLIYLGGVGTPFSLPNKGQIFSYSFPADKRREALLFFANKAQNNPAREELQKEVKLEGLPEGVTSEEEYLSKYSYKTFEELNGMFLPVKKPFRGVLSSLLRDKEESNSNSENILVTLTVALQIGASMLALGFSNGNIELWNLESGTFSPVRLYSTLTVGREQDKRITNLKLLFSSISRTSESGLEEASFVVETVSDIFIIKLIEDFYPTIQKIELRDKVMSLCVLSGSTIAVGYRDNTIDIYGMISYPSRSETSLDSSHPEILLRSPSQGREDTLTYDRRFAPEEDFLVEGEYGRSFIKEPEGKVSERQKFTKLISLNKDNQYTELGTKLRGVFKLVKRGNTLLSLSEEFESLYLKEYSLGDKETVKENIALDIEVVDILTLKEYLALPSSGSIIRLISSKGDENLEIEDISAINKVYSYNNNLLIIPSEGYVTLLKDLSDIIKYEGTNKYNVSASLFLAEENKLILGGKTGEIELFNLETGVLEVILQSMPSLETRTKEDEIVALIYDGNNVISASKGGEVLIWE